MLSKIVEEIRNESFMIDPQVIMPHTSTKPGKVKGDLCEESVRRVLDKYNFERLKELPSCERYDWKRNGGVSVYDKQENVYRWEGDDIGHLASEFSLVEVKARLRGDFMSKFQKGSEFCKKITDKPPVLLLFTAFNRLRDCDVQYIKRMEKKGRMYAIDTGWDKAALDMEVNAFYEFQTLLSSDDTIEYASTKNL